MFKWLRISFRRAGLHSERFEERKAELDKLERDRRRREKLVSTKRKRLAEKIKWFFDQMSSNAPEEEALQLSEDISDRLQQACRITDRQRAAQEVLQIEKSARAQLRNIETRYRIVRPRIALSKTMQKEWHDYTEAFSELSENVFRETRELIEGVVADEAAKARVEIDRRLRTETALDELAKQARQRTRKSGSSVRKEAEKVTTKVRRVATECISDVEEELRTVVSEFQRTDISTLTDEELVRRRDNLESRILAVTDDRSRVLESLLEQLQMIDPSGKTSALDALWAVEQTEPLT